MTGAVRRTLSTREGRTGWSSGIGRLASISAARRPRERRAWSGSKGQCAVSSARHVQRSRFRGFVRARSLWPRPARRVPRFPVRVRATAVAGLEPGVWRDGMRCAAEAWVTVVAAPPGHAEAAAVLLARAGPAAVDGWPESVGRRMDLASWSAAAARQPGESGGAMLKKSVRWKTGPQMSEPGPIVPGVSRRSRRVLPSWLPLHSRAGQ